MLKRTFSAIIVAGGLASEAVGSEMQDQHSVCMSESGGVTSAILDCIAVAVDNAETAIAISQDNLFRAASAELRTKLLRAEKQWSAYRSSTCQVEAVAAGTGSFSNVALLDCTLRITWARSQWLERILANPDLTEE